MNDVAQDGRENVRRIVAAITSSDEKEEEQKQDVLSWIDNGSEIYRVQKPDKPPKHLVSYFVPIDVREKSILLVDHIKAQLWLPPGGHVEINEAPDETVRRECVEELGIDADFLYGRIPYSYQKP